MGITTIYIIVHKYLCHQHPSFKDDVGSRLPTFLFQGWCGNFRGNWGSHQQLTFCIQTFVKPINIKNKLELRINIHTLDPTQTQLQEVDLENHENN